MSDSTAPRVHRYDTTEEAYDWSQTGEIADGDILVVENEQAIAVLMGAYPVALTEGHGEFHAGLMESARRHEGGRYAASVDVAEKAAAEHGLTIEAHHKEPGPAVHRFKSSMEATAAADRGYVGDGDVMVVVFEGAVAVRMNGLSVALTEANGAFRPVTILRRPPREYSRGKWAASVETAERIARTYSYELAEPAPGYLSGQRQICPDGVVRTIESATDNPATMITTLAMDDGATFPAYACQLVDAARIASAKATATQAAARVADRPDPDDLDWCRALTDLEDALDYLAHADPAAVEELTGGRTRRITMEVPRTLVAKGDILHAFGARLAVFDTGVTSDPGQDAAWWAQLEGITSLDKRATYREPWTMSVDLGTAMWDIVTVDRVIPAA
ncbi:hypothetical protein ACWCPK_38350 [Streptomyces sp. NPDC001953]